MVKIRSPGWELVSFSNQGQEAFGGRYLHPTALKIIAPEAFCEVDSGQRGAVKAWLDVFTNSADGDG
jgi:hypothetical protein